MTTFLSQKYAFCFDSPNIKRQNHIFVISTIHDKESSLDISHKIAIFASEMISLQAIQGRTQQMAQLLNRYLKIG